MERPLPVNYSELNQVIQCHAETIYRFNGVWEGPDPLTPIVPLFLVQITLSILATRLCVLALKPFNQPPFVAEILVSIHFFFFFFSFQVNNLFIVLQQLINRLLILMQYHEFDYCICCVRILLFQGNKYCLIKNEIFDDFNNLRFSRRKRGEKSTNLNS